MLSFPNGICVSHRPPLLLSFPKGICVSPGAPSFALFAKGGNEPTPPAAFTFPFTPPLTFPFTPPLTFPFRSAAEESAVIRAATQPRHLDRSVAGCPILRVVCEGWERTLSTNRMFCVFIPHPERSRRGRNLLFPGPCQPHPREKSPNPFQSNNIKPHPDGGPVSPTRYN